MLHKLLQLYTRDRAVGATRSRSSSASRTSTSARRPRPSTRTRSASIMRDELKDADGALARFDQALDLDPTGMLKAFEAINKILTQKKDWKALERAFRKMLHRVTGKGDRGAGVQPLAQPRPHLPRPPASSSRARPRRSRWRAAAARERAGARDPRRALRAASRAAQGRRRRAPASCSRSDPYRVDSYRALYKLYFDAREYDSAWCVAAALQLPARRRTPSTRSSTSSTSPRGRSARRPPQQRALGEGPLPPGRGLRRRQALRGGHARRCCA